jgi:hypothetical protein
MRTIFLVVCTMLHACSTISERPTGSWCFAEFPTTQAAWRQVSNAQVDVVGRAFLEESMRALRVRSVVELTSLTAARYIGKTPALGNRYYLVRAGTHAAPAAGLQQIYESATSARYEIHLAPQTSEIIIISYQNVTFETTAFNIAVVVSLPEAVDRAFVACERVR